MFYWLAERQEKKEKREPIIRCWTNEWPKGAGIRRVRRKSSKWNEASRKFMLKSAFLGNSLSIPHMYADDSSRSRRGGRFSTIAYTGMPPLREKNSNTKQFIHPRESYRLPVENAKISHETEPRARVLALSASIEIRDTYLAHSVDGRISRKQRNETTEFHRLNNLWSLFWLSRRCKSIERLDIAKLGACGL